MITKCKHCKHEFDLSDKPKGWMANHSRWCDTNPKRTQYANNLSNTRAAKTKEGTIIAAEKIRILHKQGRYDHLDRKTFLGKKHTEESKTKMRISRAKYLKENPDLHPWKRNDKFLSVPCQIVKDYLLLKNINFVEEFPPLEDRFFSIDIAFPDIKVGIEINGNQHYSSGGNLLPYYQKRHDLIVESGWTLFELSYTVAYDLSKIDDIISKLTDYGSSILS